MKDSYQINIYSPRHQKREESPSKSSDQVSHLAKDEEHLNFLKSLYFILSVLSVFLSLFSYYTWTCSKSHSVLALSLISVLNFISGIFGILGSFKGIKDLKYRHLILAGEKEGQGKNYLMISFFLMLLTFTLFLVFGSHALFYSERTMSYLQATFTGNTEDFQSSSRMILMLITISGYTAYLLIIVQLLIVHFAFLLSLLYDSIDRIFEILNINLLNLGLGIVYITIYCLKYHAHLKFLASIQANTLYSIISVSVLLCVICVLGFFTVRSQTLNLVKFYMVSNFFMIIICALCATVSVKSNYLFRTGLNEKCFDLMAIVHQDYLRGLGCDFKYLNTTNDETEKCEEGTPRVIWEAGLNDEFGCLNTNCCNVLVADAKTKFDYLGICAGSAVAVICLALWACYYIWNKLNSNLAHHHKIEGKVLAWAFLAPIVTVFFITWIPDPPYLPFYMNALETVKSSSFFDNRLMDSDWKYSGFSVGNISKCKDCEYQSAVKTINGEINESEFIQGDLEKILEYYQNLRFTPSCRNKEHFIAYAVYKKEGLDLTKVSEFNSFYLKSQKHEIFGEVYPQEFEVLYKGLCVDVQKSENKVKISADLHYYRTASSEVLQFFAPGYLSVTRTVQIGGLPLFPYTLPPTILLLPSEPVRVTIRVSSVYEDPISKYRILLRTGYNNFTGPSISYNFSSNEGILVLEKNVYSLTTISEGFKTDYSELVNQNLVQIYLTPNTFANNEIRIVAQWNGDIDLDLRAKFKFSDDFDCDIAAFNKICGSARLTSLSKPGKNVEEISLVKTSPVYYLFYLKEIRTEKAKFLDAGAVVKVYIKEFDSPVVMLSQQKEYNYLVSNEEFKIWAAFCLDGLYGASSLAPVQGYFSINHLKNMKKICEQFYGSEGESKKDFYESLVLPNNISLSR